MNQLDFALVLKKLRTHFSAYLSERFAQTRLVPRPCAYGWHGAFQLFHYLEG